MANDDVTAPSLDEQLQALVGQPIGAGGPSIAPDPVNQPMIRHWAAELRDEPTSENWLLAALSDPTERATAIEVMALKQLSSFDSNSKQPEVLEWLGQFQTPEDKQAAARVVPYLTNLTENQRQDVLSRLK